MLALLLGLTLFTPPAAAMANPAPCDSLKAEIGRHVQRNSPEGWERVLRLIRENEACYTGEIAQWLYENEVYVLDRLGRHAEALDRVDDFFRRFTTLEDSSLVRRMYQRRGFLHYHLGNMAEAVHNYILTLEYAPDWPPAQRANFLLDIGIIFQRFDNYEAAQEYYHDAAQYLNQAQETDSLFFWAQAKRLLLQADLLLEQTGLDTTAYRQAAALAQESVAISMREHFLDRSAFALIALAEATSYLGDTKTASRHYEHARRLEPHVTERTFSSVLALKRGQLFMQVGAYPEALRTLNEALQRAQSGQHIDFERRALLALGWLYDLQGQYEQAVNYFRKAVEVTELFRQSLRMTDWSLLAFSEWQYAHRDLVRALLARGQYREAFEVLEQTRARHLLDLHTQAQLLTRLSPTDSARFNDLTAALVVLQNQLATDTLDTQSLNTLRTHAQLLIAERRTLLNVDDAFDVPPLDSLQRLLAQRNQVVLSYFLDSKSVHDVRYGRTPRPHVFVLTEDTLAAVPLTLSADSARALMAQVSPLFEKPETVPDFDDRLFSMDALHLLYQRLYAPAAPYVPEGARLVVIPDGPLFMLPFGMLVAEKTPEYQYREAPYLLKKHPVSTELATALLLKIPATGPMPTYDIVAFGKSQFSDTELPTRAAAIRSNVSGLINLPAVIDEINAIGARFGRASTRLDASATEAAFFELAASARILHLASHTLLRPSMPLQNAIVLSKDPANDGFLYLHEIQRRTLPTELVVLSGCGTAQGVLHRGEGMAGLQYAFRAMGVQSSLATSWFVEDKTALRLMVTFYDNLQAGLPRDVALQQAQLRYLEEAEGLWASPFLWAAPVLYGDATPMTLGGRFLTPLLRIALVLLLLLVLYLGFHSIRKRSSHR